MRRDGFTLIELLVAMACAGIVALAAFGAWGNMHGNYVRLQKEYQASSSQLLQDIVQMKNRVLKGERGSIENRY
jgi:prepilin-type N-terminal cleavage/methylation domain-containing protein